MTDSTAQLTSRDEHSALEELSCRAYPQVIKYMGSKAKVIDRIASSIDQVFIGNAVCDLFSGACSLSGAIGHKTRIISNDIQGYSHAIAHCYLRTIGEINADDIIEEAGRLVSRRWAKLPTDLDYSAEHSLRAFQEVEKRNQALIDRQFTYSHHLFIKYYSGTWWSAWQCLWIDCIREVADRRLRDGAINASEFNFILTCLMHAMAYCSQGTGHYAQFRDAKTEASMRDINKYRQNSIKQYFKRKLESLLTWNQQHVVDRDHEIYTTDYKACLAKLPRCTVYADPPYAFVHYSRFYHALETLYHYDYPALQIKAGNLVKGRYREDRHQSPFCIRSQVSGAFSSLFDGIRQSSSSLVLSYSNTGMIEISELLQLARDQLGGSYEVWQEDFPHTHMTMGRRRDRDRQVRESLIFARTPK